jgi:hypothetical protein
MSSTKRKRGDNTSAGKSAKKQAGLPIGTTVLTTFVADESERAEARPTVAFWAGTVEWSNNDSTHLSYSDGDERTVPTGDAMTAKVSNARLLAVILRCLLAALRASAPTSG